MSRLVWIILLLGFAADPGPLFAQGRASAEEFAPLRSGEQLHLADLLERVASRSPRIRAARAHAAAAVPRVREASTLPDPMLQLGFMNVGLPDFNADMPATMAPMLQLTQSFPFPGKLSLRGEIATAARDMAVAGAREAEWVVRDRAADLFYRLYALDRQLEVMRGTLSLLIDFQAAAKAMYAAGNGRQVDVLRADVEVARMDGEIRKMQALRITVVARLNGVLDQPADAPLGLPVFGRLPADVPQRDTLRAWAEGSRPILAQARRGVEQAEARMELARKEIWPNLTIGLAYGQRDRGAGVERMGSAIFGVSLPVHAGSRQLALREESAAARVGMEADLAGFRAEVDARIGELLAELDRARTLIRLYRGEVLPEARATVESAFSSYRVGVVDFTVLVDAQMTVNRYEGELFQVLADYGRAIASLESAIGRELPDTQRAVTEDGGDR